MYKSLVAKRLMQYLRQPCFRFYVNNLQLKIELKIQKILILNFIKTVKTFRKEYHPDGFKNKPCLLILFATFKRLLPAQ